MCVTAAQRGRRCKPKMCMAAQRKRAWHESNVSTLNRFDDEWCPPDHFDTRSTI